MSSRLGFCGACPDALRARTNFPQIKPRINPQIVVIIPRKLQCILTDSLGRHRLHCWLKHWQGSRSQFRRLPWLALRLRSLIFAKRARTSVPQKCKRVDGPVPIFPLNLQPLPGRQMNHDRLGIIADTRCEIRECHKFQYRTPLSVPCAADLPCTSNGPHRARQACLPARAFADGSAREYISVSRRVRISIRKAGPQN
jgi:hypothetical protein